MTLKIFQYRVKKEEEEEEEEELWSMDEFLINETNHAPCFLDGRQQQWGKQKTLQTVHFLNYEVCV